MTSRASRSRKVSSQKVTTTPAEAVDRAYPSIDPRTLGRPLHLIDRLAAQIRSDLTEKFCLPLNLRYGAGFEVADVSLLHSSAEPRATQQWLHHLVKLEQLTVAIDRSVLLGILHYRYGTVIEATEPATTPVSASAGEERLAAALGAQLLSMVTGRSDSAKAAAEDFSNELRTGLEVTGESSVEDPWVLRVDILERSHNLHGPVLFTLDGTCVTQLLKRFGKARERAAAAKDADANRPLAARLQLTLVARLLEKEIPLGVLLNTSIGGVIPISLGRTDVLIGDSRIFTATVAEHRGKLCLTSFEDVE